MTYELFKEAIYAVALRDMLNKYPYGSFGDLFMRHLESLDLKSDKARIFYQMSVEPARNKLEPWTKIIGRAYYPKLRDMYITIVHFDDEDQFYKAVSDGDYKRLSVSHCIDGKWFCPYIKLDYDTEEFSDILRQTPGYRQINFTKELEQIKLDRIKEDF